MNFDYTDEQNMLRDSIAKWAAGQYDFDKRREALRSEDAWKTNWATFAELGLLMAPLPEEYGGLGGGPIDINVVAEEFGKALVVEPYVPTVVIGGGAIKYAGSAAQKEEHLNAIAGGERVIAFAQAEPKSRWTFTPRSVGVSIRCRNSCGRASPARCVAPLACPLAWQSRQLTPRCGRSERRSSVALNCCCGKGVTSRRKPSSCLGFRTPLNNWKKLSCVTSLPFETSPRSGRVVR